MCLMTITCRIRMWTLSLMKTNPIAAPTVTKVLGKRAICMDTLRRFMKGNGPTLAICARRVLRWNNTLISTLQVDMVLKVFIILGFFSSSCCPKIYCQNFYCQKMVEKKFSAKKVFVKKFLSKVLIKKTFIRKLLSKKSSEKSGQKRVHQRKFLVKEFLQKNIFICSSFFKWF